LADDPLAAVRRVVEPRLQRRPKAFDDDTALVSGGLIDSMSLVDLILDLEEVLGVKIPVMEVQPDDFDSVRTIARTVDRFR
jgi:acyl carrier protein